MEHFIDPCDHIAFFGHELDNTFWQLTNLFWKQNQFQSNKLKLHPWRMPGQTDKLTEIK